MGDCRGLIGYVFGCSVRIIYACGSHLLYLFLGNAPIISIDEAGFFFLAIPAVDSARSVSPTLAQTTKQPDKRASVVREVPGLIKDQLPRRETPSDKGGSGEYPCRYRPYIWKGIGFRGVRSDAGFNGDEIITKTISNKDIEDGMSGSSTTHGPT